MYFNAKSFNVFIGIATLAYSGGGPGPGPVDPISNACDAQVVLQASQEGFLKYVLINCIDEDITNHINYNGGPTLSPSICLNAWIKDHQTGSPIPRSGNCRSAYQNFVYAAAQYLGPSQRSPVFASGQCSYDQSTGDLTINDSCVTSVLNTFGSSFLGTFFNEAGHHLAGQQCSAVTVRKLSIASAYTLLVQHAAVPSDYTSTLVESVFNDDSDGGLCYQCYHTFARSVGQGILDDSLARGHTLGSDCIADPNSENCFESTAVQNALAAFQICSGGFDMQFVGPVCSPTEIDAVQSLIPVPYYTLSICAYNPNFKFCESIQSYLNGIERFSDSSCLLCYQDFYNTMLENAAITENIAKCTASGDNDGVWDTSCIAIAGPALEAFHACSGYALSITKPTVAPPIVVTPTTEAPSVMPADVMETSTTAAPEATSTTVEPTTTKSSSSSVSVGVAAIMLIVAAYLV